MDLKCIATGVSPPDWLQNGRGATDIQESACPSEFAAFLAYVCIIDTVCLLLVLIAPEDLISVFVLLL